MQHRPPTHTVASPARDGHFRPTTKTAGVAPASRPASRPQVSYSYPSAHEQLERSESTQPIIEDDRLEKQAAP